MVVERVECGATISPFMSRPRKHTNKHKYLAHQPDQYFDQYFVMHVLVFVQIVDYMLMHASVAEAMPLSL